MKKIVTLFAFAAMLCSLFSCETYKVGEPEMSAIHQIDGKFVGFALNPSDATDTLSVYAVQITNTTNDESDRAWVTVIDMDTYGRNWQRLFAVQFPVSVDIKAQTFKADNVAAEEPDKAWNPYIEGLYGNYGAYTTYGAWRGKHSVSASISGKVVTDGINTASGYKADSLEFDYTLVMDDGSQETVHFVGMKKTGWPEDMAAYMNFCDNYLW
ncbi:MAG: hypothetical protein IJ654_03575 [Bacteroidales bacterium]|nr:hypothetical protein [Bacteroidales bacterium]